MNKLSLSFLLAFIFLTPSAQQYQNFEVSVYCRAYEVKQMADTNNYLKPKWDEISRQLKVDKVYLETHRDLVIVDQKTLDMAKKFFKDGGIEVDTNTFVAESFLDQATAINIVTSAQHNRLTDIGSDKQFIGETKPGMSFIEKNRKEKNVLMLQ